MRTFCTGCSQVWFLHHFEDARLAELFRAVAGRARLFAAIEPRRAPWPLFCCRLLWAIGCNSVTRHDAAISVRAGFSGRELSALWPADSGWQCTERRAGVFSHLFVARKISGLECADMSALSLLRPVRGDLSGGCPGMVPGLRVLGLRPKGTHCRQTGPGIRMAELAFPAQEGGVRWSSSLIQKARGGG